MEHESFEDEGIAALLNRDFVSIKVDREERPDVDRVYMAFVQASTGQGGWPMTVFLTPELKPFFGGTYFPPTSRWGRPGFADLLAEIARVWKEDRPHVDQAAAELTQRLRSVTLGGPPESEIAEPPALDAAVAQFSGVFDRRNAGFGATRSTPSGACRISRRCCTTRRSSRSRTWRPRRRPARRSTRRSRKTPCSTCCGT
jgi:uncharacterized protein YyaL (SSP411 family)